MGDSAGNSGEKKPRGRPFKPGQSGNPTGRPPGAEGLAKYLRKLTRRGKAGGDELYAIAMGTARRPDIVILKDGSGGERVETVEKVPGFGESIAAWKVLFARMLGSETKFIEVSGPNGGPVTFDLKSLGKLSDDDLHQLEGILERAAGAVGPGGGEGGEGPKGSSSEG